MASAVTHAFVVVVGSTLYRPAGNTWRIVGTAVGCSLLPDLDVLGFAVGIQYGDLLGHRGLTHSLFFAVLVGLVATRLVVAEAALFSKQWWGAVVFFTGATASHGVLDAMTDGGLGVAFLSPFDQTRYFLPWRPLRVPPIGVELFFSQWGLQVLASELISVWLPGLVMGALGWYVEMRRKGGRVTAGA